MVDLLVRHDSATIGTGGPVLEPPPQPRPVAPGFEWPRTAQRLLSAFRGHPYRQDTALALTVLLLDLLPSQPGQPSELLHAGPLLLVVSLVQSLALIWRRPAQVTVFAAVLLSCTVEWSAALSSSSDISLMICLYTIARYRSLMALRVALCAIAPSLIVLMVRLAPVQGPTIVSLFLLGAAVAASTAFGLLARERQAQLAALAERAINAEEQREQRARLAVLAERARFSRETHDIVGHSLAVIIGLSDGGARQVQAHPDRGRQVFELIAETSRQSLADLRQTLGALREDRFDAERGGVGGIGDGGYGEGYGDGYGGVLGSIGAEAFAPQPGFADISDLLERTRSAGPQVSCRASGETAALPRGLQSAIYRIVQESLTNSLKHAGPDTSVQVVIEADAKWLRMSVADSGPADPRRSLPAPPHARGQGLTGVRERAVLAGGRAEAGPNDAGGWTVAARFPLVPAGRREPAMTSVLIVDDQPLQRMGFRMVLETEPGVSIAGEAENGIEAVRRTAELTPDVVLMDIRMPGMDGIEATRRITAAGGRSRVLVLTTFDLDEYVYAALQAGASGFLLKDARPDELLAGIRAVAVGDAVVAPALTRRLLHAFAKAMPGTGRRAAEDPRLSALTERELEVLRVVAAGLTNLEIAAQLHLSESTVKTHVSRAMAKIGARDRVQAVIIAYDVGLVDPRG